MINDDKTTLIYLSTLSVIVKMGHIVLLVTLVKLCRLNIVEKGISEIQGNGRGSYRISLR